MSVQLTGRFSLINKEKLDSISESELRFEGMRLVPIKGQKTPQFSYVYQHINIKDWTQPTADKLGLQRTISLSAPASNLNVLLATAKNIQKVSDGLYAIDNANYYIKLPIGTNAVLMDKEGKTLLMVELKGQEFTYEIVF